MGFLASVVHATTHQLRLAHQRRNQNQLILAALLGGLLACSSLGTFEPLGVTLADLEVTEITVFETTLAAKLRVTNPNPEDFTIEGASFKLYLEDKKVGSGASNETFTVERLDSTVVDVLFHLNNASAILRLKDILDDDEVSYGIRGGLFTQGVFGSKKLKVEQTGRIDLKKSHLPRAEEPERDSIVPPGGVL
jgi:LEA14-like dessication related protein